MKALALVALLASCGGLDAHVAAAPDDMTAHPYRDNRAFADMTLPAYDLSWPGYPDVCNICPSGGNGTTGGHPIK